MRMLWPGTSRCPPAISKLASRRRSSRLASLTVSSTCRPRPCQGAKGRGSPWPRSSWRASTSPCSTSRRTTSISTGWRVSSTWWRAAVEVSSWSLTTAPFSTASVTDVLELDEHSHSGRVYGGGWSGYQAERASERGHAGRGVLAVPGTADATPVSGPTGAPVGDDRRQPRATPAARQRQGATRLPHQSHREAGRTRPAVRARPRSAAGRREALGGVGSAVRHQRSGALGCRGRPPRGGRSATRRSHPRSLHPRHRLGRARAHSSARTARERRPWSRPFSGACRWRRGPGGSGRAWSSASWRKVAGCSTRLPLWSTRSRWPPVWRRGRPGRSWQSSASTHTPPPDLHPRSRPVSAPGRNWPPSPPEASTSSCSTSPTNHLDLPAIEQLEDALRSYRGTLLLVSHDRRMLETVELTRRVLLPARDQEFRGLLDDR